MSEVRDDFSKLKGLLADHIGVEPEDIEAEDYLTEDLHMTPTDLTDFTHVLEQEGFITTKLDFTQIQTVNDLIEALSGSEEIS